MLFLFGFGAMGRKIDHFAQRPSRCRLTLLFRMATGEVWQPHLRPLIIEHAKHLLTSSKWSVGAGAFECGFEDLSSFNRAFNATTQLPPNAWRDRRGTGIRHAI